MTSSQKNALAVCLATFCFGTLLCQPILDKILEAEPVMVLSGANAILLVPGMLGILSVTWQAPDGRILGLWAQGQNGGSSGVAYSPEPLYSGRVNITNTHLQIATVQLADTGNYTATVVTNINKSLTISSVVVELKVYEDTSKKRPVSAILEAANSGLDDISVADKRNADPCTARGCMWEKSSDGNVYVPYVLGNEYSPAERTFIEATMTSIQSSTCIRFQSRQSERDYLGIYSRRGCSSFVGRQGGEQVLSLQRQGCLFQDIIQHELLHALGFNHEHQRSDRDSHVQVLLQNVQPDAERNFDKVDTLNQNSPYDYNSVMHYESTAFSKNGQPTLVPIPDSSVPIGTAVSMSNSDFTRLSKLYKCNILSVRLTIQSTAIEGESVILQCTWSGGAQRNVTWKKDGVLLTQSSRIIMSDGLLGISSLLREDAGEYSCTVATEMTSETSTASLMVYYKCLTLGGLIGIVIACFIVLCALCITIVLLVKQRKAQKKVHTAYGVDLRNANYRPYNNS